MDKINKNNIEDVFALTPVQEGMLFHYLKNPDSGLYFEQLCLQISGSLDMDIFKKACSFVVTGNEMLRTLFRWKKLRKPVQLVLKEHQPELRFIDRSSDEAGEAEIKIQDKQENFDLEQVPFRLTLCKIAKDRFEMIISSHHILYDGWSNGIILKEFFAAYNELASGREMVIPAKNKFKEFVSWIQAQKKSGQEEFWKDYLAGFDSSTGLPVKKTGEKRITGRAADATNDVDKRLPEQKKLSQKNRGFMQGIKGISTRKNEFPEHTVANLAKFVKKNKVTLASLLYTVYGILLLKYSNKDDVVFGITTAGRSANIKGIENIVGLFINTLPLRVWTAPGEGIISLLHRVNEAVRQVEGHETTPLVDVRKYSQLGSNEELFDTIVVIENYPLDDLLAAAGSEKFVIDSFSIFEMTNYDLTLSFMLSRGIRLDFIYNRQVVDSGVVERLSRHFTIILEEILANPQKEFQAINILTEEEKRQLLFDFNDTTAAYPEDKKIHELFENQVEKTPHHTALVGAKHSAPEQKENASPQRQTICLTYRHLNREAAILAQLLIEKGVKPDTIVPLLVERSLEMIAAILGILKAGAAYLPMEPTFPAGRVKFMLSDSGAGLLLTSRSMREEVEQLRSLEVEKVFIEECRGAALPFCSGNECLAPTCVHPSGKPIVGAGRAVPAVNNTRPVGDAYMRTKNLAYIIYTSGTTGRPKGVLIEHVNLVRLFFNDRNLFDFGSEDVWTMFHSYCFDFSVWEIYGALLYGGKLVIIDRMSAKDPRLYRQELLREKVTVVNQTPSAFYNLISEDLQHDYERTSIRYVIFGGEALNPLRLKDWAAKYPAVKLVNMFGITETTVHVTYKEIGSREIRLNISSIGKPIPTLSTYIMDRHLQLLPVGTAGELCVGGAGVGRGYLNKPELTAEKFVSTSGKQGATFNDQSSMINHQLTICDEKTLHHNLNSMMQSHKRFPTHVGPWTPAKTFVPGVGARRAVPRDISNIPLFQHSIIPGVERSGTRLYRSGDLARLSADGEMEYLGRIDQQVQIRGFRVELGEIETRLLQHKEIKEAVVTTREDNNGDKYICSYIVPRDPASQTGGGSGVVTRQAVPPGIRQYLSQTLPDYMLPAHFVVLGRIPLTANGKIDRKALPRPEIKTGRGYVTPVSEVEKKMAAIWSEVLGIEEENIGIDDNFFELGGHSLRATVILARIHKIFNMEIPMTGFFKTPTIRAQAEYIKGSQGEQHRAIYGVEKKEYYALSSAQKRLYIIQQMEPENSNYNIYSSLKLAGDVDKVRMEQTLRQLIGRYESLRTSFEMIAGEAVQKIHAPRDIEFEIEYFEVGIREQGLGNGHLRASPSEGIPQQPRGEPCVPPSLHPELNVGSQRAVPGVRRLIDRFIRPFDLAKAPLLHICMIKIAHGEYIFLMDMHHIIFDGFSMGIFLKEFFVLYEGGTLPVLRLHYKDFSEWQKRTAGDKREKARLKNREEYWLEEFSGEIPLLDIKTDYMRPQIKRIEGNTVHFEIGAEETQLLKRLAKEEEATLFMILIALFYVLLFKLSGQEDIVIGTFAAGRRHADVERIIGMFVVTLPLRNFPAGNKKFREFLREIKKRTLKAFENQEYPYEELVGKVVKSRDMSRNPLYDVGLIWQNLDWLSGNTARVEKRSFSIIPLEYSNMTSKLDIFLRGFESDRKIVIAVEYCTRLFMKKTIDRIISYFLDIVSAVIQDPDRQLGEIVKITSQRKQAFLARFSEDLENE